MGKNIMFLLLLIISSSQNLLQLQDQIYRGYISGDMKSWQSAVEGLQQLYENEPSAEVLYNLLLSQYGLAAYYLGTEEKEKAAAVIENMEENLERLEKHEEYKSRQLALRGAWLGYRIGLNPLRGITLGPRSMEAIEEALRVDISNPTAHLEKANALFYAPPMFGGSKTEAISHYKEALRLMEQQENKAHRWLYLSTLVSLANAYKETDNAPLAVATLRKALKTEPDFQWVKDELLPEMMEKL